MLKKKEVDNVKYLELQLKEKQNKSYLEKLEDTRLGENIQNDI